MSFLYPLAFIGLISIPIIVIMYLLKQNYEEYKFSTNIFWKKVLEKTEANKPWQKYRRELLMFLQILAAFFIVLALSNPSIIKKGMAENYIFVLDSSISMQAVDTGDTRFNNAKKDMEDYINNLPNNSEFALVIGDNNPRIVNNFTGDKKQIINKIREIKVGNTGVDEEALTNILNVLTEQKDGEVHIFSDYGMDIKNGYNHLYGGKVENLSIKSMKTNIDADRVVGLVKVKNYGDTNKENSLAIYLDNQLIEIKDFNIKANGEENIFFTDIPLEGKELMVKLVDEDFLEVDNTYYETIKHSETKEVIMFSKGNIFIENVLSLMPDIELYKGDINNMEDIPGYYLYVFDGVLPEKMPEDGNILVFNPPEGNAFINTKEDKEILSISKKNSQFLNFIEDMDINILKAKEIENPIWGNIVLDSNIGPLIITGENNNQKAGVFAFDLHNSDFPLKKEFPIFIYNLIEWTIPKNIYDGNVYIDEIVKLNTYPSAKEIKIIDPEGKKLSIDLLKEDFRPSKKGFYLIEQNLGDRKVYDSIPVNIKAGEEVNLFKDSILGNTQGEELEVNRNYNIKNVFLILGLLILIIEWLVQNNGKFVMPDIVRTLLFAILLLSLFNINIKRYTKNTTTIFALDMSESVLDAYKSGEKEINSIINEKAENDHIGSVGFGKKAYINTYPNKDKENIYFNLNVDGRYSDLSSALVLSQSIMNEDSKKRIVLISDGKENIGDSIDIARNMGIPIDTYKISGVIGEEVQISELNIPKSINKGSNYNIEINIYSNKDNGGILKLYKNDNLILNQEVDLKTGDNRLVFTDNSDIGGNLVYKAEIEPFKDTIYENNILYDYSYVEDIPKILLVNNNGSTDEIRNIIENTNIIYEEISPFEMIEDMVWINNYDTIILGDISIDDMPEKMPDIIESYVKSGGGLIAVGGENSFALGGYHNTKLEDILPVSMELKDEEELPNQGMIIVMDRSGSMGAGSYGVNKFDLAKEASIRAIDALSNEDYFGFLVFDTENIWQVEYGKVENNKEEIKDKIAKTTLGGGTLIKPAVEEAYNILKEGDTKLKHILLITDGQDQDRDYTNLINNMKNSGITFSTVSIGSDADTSLLENIAKMGDGRYYHTDEFTDLPKIFTKETFLAGKKYIINEEFHPILGDYNPITGDIHSLPSIFGYIGSTPKPRADIVLYALDDNPLLATWQYGLGKTVAYLSDYNGNWSRYLINTDEGVKLFRNMLSYTLRSQVDMDIETNIDISGEQGKINIKLPFYDDIKSIKGNIISKDMEEIDMDLDITAPGEYEGIVPIDDLGVYLINLEIEDSEGVINYSSGINIPYSREFDIENLEDGEEKLRRIAEVSGGNYLETLDNVFKPLEQDIYKSFNINPFIIILLLVFLLFDIAYRRFPIIRRYFNKFKIKKAGKNGSIKEKPKVLVEEKIKANKKDVDKDIEGLDKKLKSTSEILLKGKSKRSGR